MNEISKTEIASSCPRYCAMLNAAKRHTTAATGAAICARSASQWQCQYAILFTPETICRCLELLRRSYTGKTTSEDVNTAAPMTTKSDVMNVLSFCVSTTSPSPYVAAAGSHSFTTAMRAFESPVRRRRMALFISFSVAGME